MLVLVTGAKSQAASSPEHSSMLRDAECNFLSFSPVCVHAHACVPRSSQCWVSCSIVFRQGLLLILKLAILPGLAGQQALGIHLSLPYLPAKHELQCLAFSVDSRDWNFIPPSYTACSSPTEPSLGSATCNFLSHQWHGLGEVFIINGTASYHICANIKRD